MANFIQNVIEYMGHFKLKNNFVANLAGIEKNKLSRLLNGKQDIQYEDMEAIAKALGQEINYFMQEKLILKQPGYAESTSIAFYMGAVDEEKEQLANQIFDFLEHVDAVLGIRKKINKAALEVHDYKL